MKIRPTTAQKLKYGKKVKIVTIENKVIFMNGKKTAPDKLAYLLYEKNVPMLYRDFPVTVSITPDGENFSFNFSKIDANIKNEEMRKLRFENDDTANFLNKPTKIFFEPKKTDSSIYEKLDGTYYENEKF
ncbi:MAG: hypothetical protein LBC44_02420 [Mycoplasmataceae bacterium]|jgi:hypothetical protein|nr:hypothetical protein [Mycoplasmataceae bacterium]